MQIFASRYTSRWITPQESHTSKAASRAPVLLKYGKTMLSEVYGQYETFESWQIVPRRANRVKIETWLNIIWVIHHKDLP